MFRKLHTTVSCIALALAVSGAAIAADTDNSVNKASPSAVQQKSTDSNKKSADAKVEKGNQDQAAEKRKQITAEAIAAVGETQNALKALDAGKKDDALSALERATGKLELILARDPKLALAPMNVSVASIDILADTDGVKQIRSQAQTLLADGHVQDARHLLEGLASETVISVSNIPLATYPDAIKAAAKLIDNGKPDMAKNVLQTALNTLVITNTTIPHPVAMTQAYLKDAETLAEKPDRKPEQNKNLTELLTQARKELEYAEVLGYGTKQDFKDLYAQLGTISDKTSSGKSGTGFFDEIKSSLSSLFKSSQPPVNTQPAPKAGADKPETQTQTK